MFAACRIVDNLRMKSLQWDIFCKVIDNFGDIGVCWRLAADLAARGHRVRLWLDEVQALAWLAPAGRLGVTVLPWADVIDASVLEDAPSDVWIEGFGCEISPEFIAAKVCNTLALALNDVKNSPVWINLEYLSAESYAGRNHGLPSLVSSGPGAGLKKWFFYPGFSALTGGLLRETDLASRQLAFDRAAWLAAQGVAWQGETLVSLFCYEPVALGGWLKALAENGIAGQPVRLLVAAGRGQRAVVEALAAMAEMTGIATQPKWKALSQSKTFNKVQKDSKPAFYIHQLLYISYLPLLSQIDFDHLLWACDLNFVRGEDSLVRGLWAGKPLVWQIYPQDDGAHHIKLAAFLDHISAPPSMRAFHQAWNAGASKALPHSQSALNIDLTAWQPTAQAVQAALLAQTDLTSQLLQFVEKNR